MEECKHDNLTNVGYQKSNANRMDKYIINSAKSKEFNAKRYEILVCDKCGVLIEAYDGNLMAAVDIADWIDTLMDIQLQKIIKAVESQA